MIQKNENMKTVRVILHYIRRYQYIMILSLLLSILSVIGTLYVPVLTGNAINLLTGPNLVAFPELLAVLLQMAVVITLTALVQWGMTLCNNRITFHTVQQIRNDAFTHIQRLPLSVLDKHPTGDLISRILTDVDQFSDGFLLGFSQLFTSVLTIIGTLVIMYIIQPIVATAVVVVTPVSLAVAAVIAKRSYSFFAKQSQIRGEQTALVEEIVTHQKTVRAFSQEEKTQVKFDEINERLEQSSLRAIFVSSITQPGTRFVNGLVYACVGIVGSVIAITRGDISIGLLVSFLSYANQYTKPFNEISGVITELQNALACAGRVFKLLDTPLEGLEAKGAIELRHIDGNVRFSGVCFTYHKDQPLIDDVSFNASTGQRIAIVGPTGCGKTTLINLLMRFYNVDQGSIFISGQSIRHLTKSSLRRAFGLVLQDTWLKTGTIRDNIAIGCEDATNAEIIAAAKAVHAHKFISQLRNGYDTWIEDDGGNLSQGQKQLISIARIMLTKPPMLVLDEATSSIDTRTELEIQKAFEQLMIGRTSFVVAHRLSTILHADQILVMNHGQIVERGTHVELIAQNGFYATIFQSQFIGIGETL